MRVLRILEYDGSESFIRKCLAGRGVVGEKRTKDGTLRESYISDYPAVCSFDVLGIAEIKSSQEGE